jgi:hypothetical protein
MPDFSAKARARIKAVVRRVEGTPVDLRIGDGTPFAIPGQDVELFELTENLAAWGEAGAHPLRWYAGIDSAIAGKKGAFRADESVTRKVRDATGMATGATGDWIRARAYGSEKGWVWVAEPIGTGGGGASAPTQRGILRTDLARGGCCVVEEGRWSGGVYARNGKTYRAFDAHEEWEGTADVSGCDWTIRDDTPTAAQLDALGKTIPGTVAVTESQVVEFTRVLCEGFFGDPLATAPG